MNQNTDKLTRKEKRTLRLLVRGYDAKSIARETELSVHTINERLRSARRKLEVSSSREAARILGAHEQHAYANQDPKIDADKSLGDDCASDQSANSSAHTLGAWVRQWALPLFAGAIIMTITLAAIALMSTSVGSADQQQRVAHETAVPADPAGTLSELDRKLVSAAEEWLALVDAGDFNPSWEQTSGTFRKLNSVDDWSAATKQAKSLVGVVKSRKPVAVQDVPTPPHGYKMVFFVAALPSYQTPTKRSRLSAMATNGASSEFGFLNQQRGSIPGGGRHKQLLTSAPVSTLVQRF